MPRPLKTPRAGETPGGGKGPSKNVEQWRPQGVFGNRVPGGGATVGKSVAKTPGKKGGGEPPAAGKPRVVKRANNGLGPREKGGPGGGRRSVETKMGQKPRPAAPAPGGRVGRKRNPGGKRPCGGSWSGGKTTIGGAYKCKG